MYAIVDIETTGGHPSSNGITEICIITHDGIVPIDRFTTLINPQQPIPPFIQAYTNITNQMVASAPAFGDIAPQIYELLHDKIFVAHSVNFDFTFIQYQLKTSGFNLRTPKLCTVRLSRKIFPGFPSYSLGNLCAQVGIEIANRHRAAGDAEATATLFSMLVAHDKEGLITQMQKKVNGEIFLPPNLDKREYEKLPHKPGVYYFHNREGKIIYIGKAKNIHKRVGSHFANNSPRRRKQEFNKSIFGITYTECATDLMAIFLESIEIKHHWPTHNRALKFNEQLYSIYDYEDQQGRIRLGIDKTKQNIIPLMTSHNPGTLQLKIWELVKEYNLCAAYCGVLGAEQLPDHTCPACNISIRKYNKRVNKAMDTNMDNKPSFAVIEYLHHREQACCYLMDDGKFFGMGVITDSAEIRNKEALKSCLTRYKSNAFIESLLVRLSKSMICIEFTEKEMVRGQL